MFVWNGDSSLFSSFYIWGEKKYIQGKQKTEKKTDQNRQRLIQYIILAVKQTNNFTAVFLFERKKNPKNQIFKGRWRNNQTKPSFIFISVIEIRTKWIKIIASQFRSFGQLFSIKLWRNTQTSYTQTHTQRERISFT